EGNVMKAGLRHTSTRLGYGVPVALDGHNLARRTHQSSCQHRHVSHPRPEIQNALPGSNARLTKESFTDGSDTHRVPDKALVFGVGVAQWVISGATARCHRVGGMSLAHNPRSHHQVATVDVKRSASYVTGGVGRAETNQMGDFESGAEARHGITGGETFDQLV